MKKLLFPAITLVIGLIAGYFFNYKPEPDEASTDYLTYAVPRCTMPDPTTQICPDSAKLLVKRYKAFSLLKGGNTRCLWLSYERVEELYNALTKDRQNNMGTDGLRIYLGNYPKECSQGVRHPHAYRNTLIFVSTKDSLNKKFHRDYFTEAPRIIAENKGELCPPGDCFDEGALLLGPQ